MPDPPGEPLIVGTTAKVVDSKLIDHLLVALTFDDGPDEWTLPILDVLQAEGVRATFFVIGESIAGRESTLERTTNEGHQIGNHAYFHRNFQVQQTAVPEICDELVQTSAAIEAVIGKPPAVFRPPGFGTTEEVRVAAGACGFDHVVNASVWTDDWNRDAPEPIVEAILSHERLGPGAIIDLHDGRPLRETDSRPSRQATVDSVYPIIVDLRAQGFEFVTVSGLLATD